MIAVLLSLVVFVGFVGLVVFLVVWGVRNKRLRHEAWARVASSLGLYYASDTIYGTLDGQQVKLWIRVERGSNETPDRYFTVVSGILEPPMDVGLSVYEEGFFANVALGFVGAQDIQIGDPEFDRRFIVRADEPHRVQMLLGPEIRRTMVDLHANRSSFRLDDSGCAVERSGMSSDEQWMSWALRTAASLTRQMNRARRSVPPASALVPHQQRWRRYAESAGLRGMDTPLCMWGKVDGSAVRVYAVRTRPNDYRIEAVALFDESLNLGLHVRPTQSFDSIRSFFGGQDVRLGDQVFDPAFVVRASRTDALPALLDPEVRQRMVELNQRVGPVQLRDDGVVLQSTSLSHHPDQAPWLIDAARTMALRVWKNARPRWQAGPYR